MELAALYSGGKDSSYALWLALKEGHEIAHLVVMFPSSFNSWMFHRPNVHLADLFSSCTGIPSIKGMTKGVKENELEDLRQVLKGLEVDGVVSGAVASSYQKDRIDGICKELGLTSLAPLWGKAPAKLLGEELSAGFDILITSVSAEGFDQTWLGRKLDENCLDDLLGLRKRFGIHLSGEGGEYETLVLDAPFFGSRIEPVEVDRVWRRDGGYLNIQKARLVSKS